MIPGFNHTSANVIVLKELVSAVTTETLLQSHNNGIEIKIDYCQKNIEIRFKPNINQSLKPIYLFTSEEVEFKLSLKLESHTNVTIIDHKTRENDLTEISCKPNSTLNYYLLQDKVNAQISLNQYHHSYTNVILLASALTDNCLKFVVNLAENNAKTNLNILQYAAAQAQQNIELLINHATFNTSSNATARIIATDSATLNLTGKILVAKRSGNITADLQSKGLIIGNKSSIINRPELLIDNNDVICSHGASVGGLDNAALFYMQTRGISLNKATELLVNAFTHPILSKIKLEPIKQYLHYIA